MARTQLEHFPNLVTMFLTRVREKGDKPFLWSKRDGAWQAISYNEAARQVAALAPTAFTPSVQASSEPRRGLSAHPTGTPSRNGFVEYLTRDYRGPRTGAPISSTSARSYVSNLGLAERLLGRNLISGDGATTESAVRAAGAAKGVSQAHIRDVISAVRAYLQYISGTP